MSWLSPCAVRRHRRHLGALTKPRSNRLALTELESRVNPTNVLQYHMDSLSDGVNNTETALTRTNVNSTTFGKLWQVQVTGQVYAEPLVETGVNITVGANQGMHNVVFVATEHDQLYAYDSDAATPTLLWQRSFLSDTLNTNPGDLLAGNTGVTTVPQSAVISSDITVEIGITGTPVIDPNTGTLYLIAKTAETVAGTAHYVQRLYAINIQTGADQTAPYLLGDTTYNGSTYVNYASESSDPNKASDQIYTHGNGQGDIANPYGGSGNVVQFNALREAVRSGLDLVNGVVYMAWASHGDNGPYHGWMVGVSAYSSSTPTMHLTGVLNTTPNGGLGGIWQAGGEITFDGTYFYFETGNGTMDGQNGTGTGSNPTAPAPGPITGLNNAGFPTNGDYGDSFVKVALDPASTATNQNITTGAANETANSDGWGLKVVDFFTPFNQNYLNSTDLDVGSSAAVVVPDYNTVIGGTSQFASAAHPKLLIGSGKEGVIYLMDRGGVNTNVNPDVPGYKGSMGGYGDRDYIVQNSTNELSGSLDSAALFNGQMYYVEGYGGVGKSFTFANAVFAAPASTVSADSFAFAGSTPMISANNGANGIVWDVDRGTNQLRAYSSDTYATELWNSAQAPGGRDALGAAVKFQVATVANGRVYVGAGTGDPNNVLDVYGLLAPPTGVPNAPSNLTAQTVSSALISLSWTDNSVSPNTADSFYIQDSTDNGTTWNQIAIVSGTSYLATGLTASTAYEFRVQAHDSFGLSGNSNVAMATTLAGGTHSINYSSGFTTANTTVGGGTNGGGLAFNGATQAVLVPGNGTLTLTTNNGNLARSVYFTNPSDSSHAGRQDIVTFNTTFTYNLSNNSGGNPADGITFVIQNDSRGLTALGGGGGQLGYGTTTQITPSLALGLNVYSGNARGTEILTNGTVDENFSETNINTTLVNDPITITITYAAGVLNVVEQQTVNSVVETDAKSLTINLPALLGSDYAYVGFTGATGGANSTQQITNWTFDQGVVPAAPTNLAATVTGFMGGANGTVPIAVPLGAHLTWNAVTDTPPAGGTVSYKILRKFTAGGTYSQVGTSTTNSFDDTGLATGSTYFYEVLATNSVSDSLPSAAVSITTPTLPPTPNMSTQNVITNTSVSFQWQDNANNENGYLILRQIGTSGFSILTTLAPDTNPAPSIMTYIDTGLTPGTHYDYHIEAFNLAGYSDFAGVSADTPTNTPLNLTATANSANGSIGLTWSAVSGGGATYNVYRGTSAGGEGSPAIATGLSGLTYSDTSLAFGTTYFYVVTATVGSTESAASNEASAFASGPTVTHLMVSPNPATPTQSVTLSANVTSTGGVPGAGSIQFYDNGSLLTTVSVNLLGIASYSTTFLAGTHNLTATYTGTTGFTTSTTATPVVEVVKAPPQVAGVQINDGSAQRSEVRSLTITFSDLVTFTGGNANAAAAFQLEHVQDSTNINNLIAAVSTNGSGNTVVTLTFTATGNAATEIDSLSVQNGGAASLADGRYQLTILAANVTGSTGFSLDGLGTGNAGSNYVSPTDTQGGGAGQLKLFRLFGDVDGSGIDDQVDLGSLRSALNSGTGNPLYISYLDADNNGFIDQVDLGQFRSRLNASIF